MNIARILSIADYEQPRTVDEPHKWWFAKHQEYGATKEGRIYCREGRKLSKKFYEEAQPMLASYEGIRQICLYDANSVRGAIELMRSF